MKVPHVIKDLIYSYTINRFDIMYSLRPEYWRMYDNTGIWACINDRVDVFIQFSKKRKIEDIYLQHSVTTGSLDIMKYMLQINKSRTIVYKRINKCLDEEMINFMLDNLKLARYSVNLLVYQLLKFENYSLAEHYVKKHDIGKPQIVGLYLMTDRDQNIAKWMNNYYNESETIENILKRSLIVHHDEDVVEEIMRYYLNGNDEIKQKIVNNENLNQREIEKILGNDDLRNLVMAQDMNYISKFIPIDNITPGMWMYNNDDPQLKNKWDEYCINSIFMTQYNIFNFVCSIDKLNYAKTLHDTWDVAKIVDRILFRRCLEEHYFELCDWLLEIISDDKFEHIEQYIIGDEFLARDIFIRNWIVINFGRF